MRSRAGALLSAALLLVLGLPAHAAARPQVTDPCGDASSGAWAQGREVTAEPGNNARDVRSALIAVTRRELQVAITACSAVSTAVSYHASWSLDESCWMDLGFDPVQVLEGVTTPQVTLREECLSTDTTPVVGSGARRVSTLRLPATAATFKGSSVSMAVPLSAVPEVSRPRLAPGVTWPRTSAMAFDPLVGVTVFAFGTYPNPDLLVNVRFDFAEGRGYTVGR